MRKRNDLKHSMFRLCLALALSASVPQVTWAQSALGKRISISVQQASVKEIFDEVNKQTGLNFIYNSDSMKKVPHITLNEKNASVKSILDYMIEEKLGCSYRINGNMVTIIKKQKTITSTRAITGVVTDEHNEPLIGVQVKVRGTKITAISGPDGRYAFMVPTTEQVIDLSYVGMDMASFKLNAGEGNEHRNVRMVSSNALKEVVVTGYYEQTKKSFTGAARSITGEELLTGSNQNVLTALQNIDPSFVMVENNLAGSNPNNVPQFQMRGTSSLTSMSDTYSGSPNMPIFIVDGFETTAEKVFDMDPYRVQNITLLKDASATAIYGSRAANGVVVITTTTPKHGKLAISYNADFTFYVPDLSAYNLCTPEQKLQLEQLSGLYDSSKKAYWNEDKYSDQIAMDNAYNWRLRNVLEGVNTDWLAQPLHELTVGQKHSVRIDGGSDAFRYAMDLNYSNTPGVMKESGRERMGIGMELQYIYKNITFRDQLSFSNVTAKNSPYGSFSDYAKLNPYIKMADENGNYIYQLEQDDRFPATFLYRDPIYNPLYNTTFNQKNQTAYNDLTNNFGIDWVIIQGLRLKGNFSFTVQNTSSDVFKSGKDTSFATLTGDDYVRRGSYQASRGDVFNFDGSLVLSYFLQKDKHVLNSNLGWNIQQDKSKTFTVNAEGFPNDNLDYISFASQYEKNGSPSGDEYTSRLVGFLGNVNYSYDEKYLLDLSFREDASSRFGAKERWAPFWSAGLGWNMHNEKWMKDLKVVNLFKLRATYGLTGSQDYDPYQAMTTYQYLTTNRYHYAVGAVLKAMGNENLSWQRTTETNIGFDLGLWDNRLQITADYYIKTSKDVLTAVTLPPSLGFTTYMANLGEVDNRGWELNARAVVVKDSKHQFYWSLFGTMLHNKNKLKKISNALQAYNDKQDESTAKGDKKNDSSSPRVRFVEGASINSIWVNKSLGVDPQTGREMFLDKNGNTTSEWSAKNYVIGGCTDPSVEGTFGTSLSYKGFQLNATFRYRMGGQIYNQTLVDKVQDIDPRYNADARALTERWQKPGDKVRFTGFVVDSEGVNISQSTRPTSRFVEDYNYLTLSTLNLSYEFNNKKLVKYGIQRLKLTAYMNDVFFTSTVKTERGTDYPFARNFSLGLQVRF